jgi:DNA-directed RNA polymerase subunit RPC12/RpoP
VYFDPAIPDDEKIVFSRYVHDHLTQKAQGVERFRHYVCPHCGTPVQNRETAMKRLTAGKPDIVCVECEGRVPLWDALEERFAAPELQEQVRAMAERARIVLDNTSKERALVGEVISTVALAGQLCREFSVGDHGIDMEIEFKSDAGEATGQKLYLQLKSGDSHLRERRDGARIFAIREPRHARYWMEQAFPVLLVIRGADGEVQWMEVRDWLKRESEGRKTPVKQILFEGERFDVMSVRRWRDRVLGRSPGR